MRRKDSAGQDVKAPAKGVTHRVDMSECAPCTAEAVGSRELISGKQSMTMNPQKVLLIVATGLLFGYGTGILGIALAERHDAESGPLPHPSELEWATALAFPGFLTAELCSGCEWHADKAWSSGQDIRWWNAAFWGLAAMAVTLPATAGSIFRRFGKGGNLTA